MPAIELGSHLEYEIKSPTTLLLNVAIAATDHQRIVDESLTIKPQVAVTTFEVGLARNRFHRLRLEPGTVTVAYRARAELTPVTLGGPGLDQTEYGDLPPEVLTYLNPSRYVESDKLANYAFAEFGDLPPNFDRVNAICDWIHEHLAYRSGTTNALTTAGDVLMQRQGVCRDFAHLGIAICRALGIPARYVSGYAARLEPPDFHGFFEAYLEGRWFLFDATRLAPPAGLVRISAGHDAADTPFATIWGSAELKSKSVWAEEASDRRNLLDTPADEVAISTA
ncbi:MAG: transglutaminase-like domain-containing protein [Hyphomicrobiaceae bacterium]